MSTIWWGAFQTARSAVEVNGTQHSAVAINGTQQSAVAINDTQHPAVAGRRHGPLALRVGALRAVLACCLSASQRLLFGIAALLWLLTPQWRQNGAHPLLHLPIAVARALAIAVTALFGSLFQGDGF